MDSMLQFYMEDTEDMLQKAEECLIRLETEYSSSDVNELFRIAHTIKGSSHMVGYEDIGNLMHKIEDMLDCVRSGSIMFDPSVVSLSFKGLDVAKKMLDCRKEGVVDMTDDLINDADSINGMVEAFIRANKKKEEETTQEESSKGIVSTLLDKKPAGKNRYYITFIMEEDVPMISPVLIMILKSVENIGTLLYSSVKDRYFTETSHKDEIKTFEIILCTDLEEAELYTYFDLCYVERINIVNITRSKLEHNDFYFNDDDDTAYIIILRVFMKLYHMLFGDPKEKDDFISEEILSSIESLSREAANACDRIKNKKQVSAFAKDLNEFFSVILNGTDEQAADAEHRVNIRTRMLKLLERAFNYTKGKHLFRVFKAENKNFINRLKGFAGVVNKSSTLMILIDLSELDILHENEIKALIELKKQMMAQGVEIGIVAAGHRARRIVNILDSIKPVEEFNILRTELDALFWMFQTPEFFENSVKKIKGAK